MKAFHNVRDYFSIFKKDKWKKQVEKRMLKTQKMMMNGMESRLVNNQRLNLAMKK